MEPLTGRPHVSKILKSMFLSFRNMIEKANKPALRNLLSLVQNEIWTITAFNLRTIIISAGHSSTNDLKSSKPDQDYCKIPEAELWRVGTLKELIELDETGDWLLLHYICTEWTSSSPSSAGFSSGSAMSYFLPWLRMVFPSDNI